MYKKLFIFSFFLFIFSYSSVFAIGTISSFTVSNTTAFSSQLISLSWNGADVSGYSLSVSCASGVKVKKEDGSLYPCDTKLATSGSSADSIGFYLVNISGSIKNINFKLYPNSTDGSENTAGVQSQSVTISPSAYPLSSVTVSATTTTSGAPLTVNWTGVDLDGANIILTCTDGVSFSSTSGGASLPCGTLAFTDKLAGSGSASLYFKNTNNDNTTVSLRVLPYIGDGTYDSTHSTTVYFDVASDKVLPFQILSFSPSQPKIASGDTLTLIWSTKYTNGVNLKADCTDGLSFSLSTTSGGQTINCGALFTDTYFGPNSSTGIIINNSSKETKTAYISLLAQLPGGGFDGINYRKIFVQVAPKGETVIFNGTTNNSVSNQTTSINSSVSNSGKLISPRKKFTKILVFGVKSDDVSALQEFLYKNGYYPEGFITGYMGSLTTKAVKKFQEAMGIAKPGQAGYGNVGPATRAKLNSL
ncbi:MAG: penicillin-resistant dd-carboxypeptidase-like protein [Parcubacteria bacterium C7867-006]|nr:MAG: penicillin-resistant dd-carboxypeptidase-like protein [Parcubacteria bacterium C7867-006]